MSSRPARLSRAGRILASAGVASISLGIVLLPWAGGPASAAQSAAAASASAAGTSAATRLTASTTASATGSTSATATTTPTPTPTPTRTVTPTPTPTRTVTPTPTPTPTPTRSHKPKPKHPAPTGRPPTPPGGAVFRGPHLWDPAANRNFTHPSYVAVSQVTQLTNQVVRVTWRNFTPSTAVTYDSVGTNYPVMVAECKGTHPTRQSECFGADNGGVQGSLSPFGPMNTQYATTSANGTGVADIQLLTAAQQPQLGCNRGSPCSLVIEPAQGGNFVSLPPICKDHSQDLGQSAIGQYAFSSAYGQCSWKERIIVPLTFAPTPTDCPVRNPNFSVIGSPMLARAMESWQASLCSVSNPIYIQYDSAQNEPLARQDFLARTNDVALTTLPANGSGSSAHPFTYAPVGISAESVAFWIDNPVTGQPLNHLKLDARLVVKLLTQSYNFENEGCGHGPVSAHGLGCDNSVDNNPASIFADPEFKQLNPARQHRG